MSVLGGCLPGGGLIKIKLHTYWVFFIMPRLLSPVVFIFVDEKKPFLHAFVFLQLTKRYRQSLTRFDCYLSFPTMEI